MNSLQIKKYISLSRDSHPDYHYHLILDYKLKKHLFKSMLSFTEEDKSLPWLI